MPTAITGHIKVIYDGVDISEDISKHITSFRYSDKSEDESDEIDITLEDTDALWRNDWYPTKGSTIQCSIGAQSNNLVDCGTFSIDEVKLSGPPDTINIRALAAVLQKNIRTKKSSAHESKTLMQIAQYVAQANGFTIVGTVPNILIKRATQHRETDLHWLRRLSVEYGVVFSLRGKQLIFTNIYNLESANSVTQIKRADLISYDFTDKLTQTYKSASISYQGSASRDVIKSTYHVETQTNADGLKYDLIVKDDVLVLHSKVETQPQADAKVKAALYRANTQQLTGSIRVIGNPLLVAGNNMDIINMGSAISAKYNIQQSVHEFTKDNGYETTCEIKAVGTVPKAQNKAKAPRQKPKVKAQAGQPEGHFIVYSGRTKQLER